MNVPKVKNQLNKISIKNFNKENDQYGYKQQNLDLHLTQSSIESDQ